MDSRVGLFGGILAAGVGLVAYSYLNGDDSKKNAEGNGKEEYLDRWVAQVGVPLRLPHAKLVAIRENFLREMRDGLRFVGKSSMPMIPSLVTRRASGEESGVAYALDFGGTNVRVLKCKLENGIASILKVVKRKIPDELIKGPGENLFDFLAEIIIEVAEGEAEHMRLGFTFSFPYEQTAVDSGILLRWTKEFTASGVEGKDVCLMLENALSRKGSSQVKVNALLNDTVGTMMAGCFTHQVTHPTDGGCVIGLILGTGANACYLEDLKRVKKMEGITNDSLGNFGASRARVGHDLHLTKYDEQLDKESSNAGGQILEKQMSGRYLGEIVRLILREGIEKGLIFADSKDKLAIPYSLSTEQMSLIDGDDSLKQADKILSEFGISSTDNERSIVRRICQMVSRRSARLAATVIAGILKHINLEAESCIVAVDGSLFEKYPRYQQMMEEALKPLHPGGSVTLLHTQDGSGVGAVVTAFVMADQ